MRFLVTGATGYLGWRGDAPARRARARRPRARPPGPPAPRGVAPSLEVVELDAGAPEARELVAGRDAVLHFAGVPDPAGARRRPRARGARERGHDAQPARGLRRARRRARLPLVGPRRDARPIRTRSPSTSARRRAACTPRKATSLRMTSVFGPGQVRVGGRDRRDQRVRRPRAGRPADHDPRQPAPHARLPLRRRPRRRDRAARRRRTSGPTCSTPAAASPRRSRTPRGWRSQAAGSRRRRSRRPAGRCRPARTTATRSTRPSHG